MLSLPRAVLLALSLLEGATPIQGQDPQPLEAALRSRVRAGVGLEDVRILKKGRWERPADPSDLDLKRPRICAVRDRAGYVEDREGEAHVVEFPFVLLQLDATTGRVHELRPVALLPPGLAFEPETRDYRGTGLFGLVDVTSPGARTALETPFQVYLHSDKASVEREVVTIDRAGLPDREVLLRLADPADDVRLFLYTDVFGQAPPLNVRVFRPLLQLEASPAGIDGFGMATSRITVVAEGAGLRGVQRVSLTVDLGALEPSDVLVLDRDGLGSAHLRSGGLGTARVRASHPHYRIAEVELRYAFPWTLLCAALLGGGLGASLRARRRRGFLRALGPGIVAAGVVLLLSAAAILLLHLRVDPGFRDAAVFLLAALAGFGGMRGRPIG